MPIRHKFTTEQIDWLKDYYPTHYIDETVNKFNKIFGLNLTESSIHHKVERLGIKAEFREKRYYERVGYHLFLPEQDEWLIMNFDTYNYDELAILMNAEFKCSDITVNVLKHHCPRALGLKKDFYRGPSKTSLPLKSETIRIDKSGRQLIWVKVCSDIRRKGEDAGSYNRFWRAKHRVVWEQANGPIPKWGCVVFLNGNTLDCSIDNLYLTTNDINGKMTKEGWYSSEKDLTLSALKWCELHIATYGTVAESNRRIKKYGRKSWEEF